MKNLEFFTDKKYQEFIEEFENNWLQYATVEEKMKSFFGNVDNAKLLFEKWKNEEDIWKIRKEIFWHLDKKSNLN